MRPYRLSVSRVRFHRFAAQRPRSAIRPHSERRSGIHDQRRETFTCCWLRTTPLRRISGDCSMRPPGVGRTPISRLAQILSSFQTKPCQTSKRDDEQSAIAPSFLKTIDWDLPNLQEPDLSSRLSAHLDRLCIRGRIVQGLKGNRISEHSPAWGRNISDDDVHGDTFSRRNTRVFSDGLGKACD